MSDDDGDDGDANSLDDFIVPDDEPIRYSSPLRGREAAEYDEDGDGVLDGSGDESSEANVKNAESPTRPAPLSSLRGRSRPLAVPPAAAATPSRRSHVVRRLPPRTVKKRRRDPEKEQLLRITETHVRNDATTPTQDTCAICYSEPQEYIAVPCGHRVCCATCFRNPKFDEKKCCICQGVCKAYVSFEMYAIIRSMVVY